MRWLGLEIVQQLGVLAAPEEDTKDLVALSPGDGAPLSLALALSHTHLHGHQHGHCWTLFQRFLSSPPSQVRLDVTDE